MDDERAHLNRVSSSTREHQGRVADDRITNDNAEFATARYVIRLASAAGWIGIVCLISTSNPKELSPTLTDKDLIVGTTSRDVLWPYRDWVSDSDTGVWECWAGLSALGSDSCQ